MLMWRLYIDDQAHDVRDPRISVENNAWRRRMALPVPATNRPDLGAWSIALNCAEAVALIEAKGMPAFVSFDHDLADGRDAIWLVRYMIEHDLDHRSIPDDFAFEVHSANPLGRLNITGLLAPYLRLRVGQESEPTSSRN